MGYKDNKGKLRYNLIPMEVLESLAEVYTYGITKYCDQQTGDPYFATEWRKVPIHEYESAMMRHYVAWRKGEKSDKESGLHHLKHMLWNVGAMLYLSMKGD